MIKVLIVEDSPVVRELLIHILSYDPNLQVIGTAKDGEEAIKEVRDKKPDVVTMDIHMPKMDGFEATRVIMETCPAPIVIVSASWDPREVEKTFMAMEAGAVAAIRKPVGIVHPHYENQARELIQLIKLMSEVKLVRRRSRAKLPGDMPGIPLISESLPAIKDIKAVTIGASTGGPPVIETILSGLPNDFPAPILIVQHIASGFVRGFADWLANSSRISVNIAVQGEFFLPGNAYIAPDDVHMGVEIDGKIILSKCEPENGLRPSVSYLFRSVAEVFGKSSVGILLSGMGKDGAYELKTMREKGAITIAQDKASCVVYGMPGEAVTLGAAMHVLAPEAIVFLLRRLMGGG